MLIKLFNDVFQFLKVRKKSLWSAFITHIFVTPNGSSEFLRFGNPLKPVGENPLIVIDHLNLFHVTSHNFSFLTGSLIFSGFFFCFQVLKYLSVPQDLHRGVDFVTECLPCRQTVRGPQCTLCKRLCMHCVICRIAVKGQFWTESVPV